MTLIHSFDLDGTLIDTRPAHHMINEVDRSKTDWKVYADACASIDLEDGPAAPILNAVLAVAAPLVDFIVVSRRNTCAREATAKQLNKRGWAPLEMLMLGDEYSDPSIRTQGAWKVDAIRRYEQRSGNTVICHYDDNPAVTEACRKAGIPAVTLTDGYDGEYAIGVVA